MATIVNTIRWADNTAELQRNLAEGLDQVEAITKSANKMARSLNTDAISAGHKWAAAVSKIGGVTKLTTDEKNRMHAALTKTLEKYQALGRTAPTALLRLHEQTKPVVQQTTMAEKATDFFRGSIVRLAAAFSIGNLIERGVSTLFAWGKQAIQAAGDVKDLADRTGLTTDTIQRMAFVAKDTGTSVESFTKAAFRLSLSLAGGSNSVQDGVAKLGLSFQDLRRMSPDEQFETIMRALSGVDDHQELVRIGVDLFGRRFMEIMPAVVQGYDNIAGAARVASRAQLDAADEASAAWDRFVQNTKTSITRGLGNLVIGAGQVWDTIKVGYAGMVGGVGAATSELERLTRKQRDGLKGVETGTKQLTVVNVDYVRQLSEARNEVAALSVEKRAQIDAAQKLGTSTEDLTAQFGISEGALKVLNETTKATVKTQSEASRETQRLRDELRGLAAVFAGAKLADDVTKANAAIALLTDDQRNNPEVIDRIAKRASELSSQGAHLTGVLLDVWLAQERWREGMPHVERGLEGILKRAEDVTSKLGNGGVLGGIRSIINIGKGPIVFGVKVEISEPTPVTRWTDGLDDLADSFARLAQVAGDSFGGIVQEIANVIAATALAADAAAQYEKATTRAGRAAALVAGGAAVLQATGSGSTASRVAGGAMSGAAIGGVFGPVGAGVGAAIGGGLGLIRGLLAPSQAAKEAARQANAAIAALKKELSAAHGGFENLSRLAGVLGVDMDTAFRAQGAAGLRLLESTAEEFEKKLERLQGALERYGLTWMDLGDQTRQAHLDQVAEDLIADFQILQTAGADVTRIVEGMSGAINQFLTNALTTGATIPPAMQPMIEQLIRTGQLTEENAALMLGLKHEAVPSWADITAAAERYGIAVDQLGPKITQIRINEEAAQIVKDFDLLVGAGAKTGVVMAGMQEKVQGLVTSAMKLGLELPASMKPMLEQMVKAGLLTDDTGKKLTNLSGLKFAEPLSAMVDALIKKLDELIDSIRGGVGAAIRDVNGRTFVIKGRVDWDNVQTGAGGPALHTGGYAGLSGIQKHHQGTARILKFHSGVASLASDEVPAILQVGESVLNRRATQQIGPEAIRALNQGRAAAGGGVTRVDVRTDALEREVTGLRQDVRDQADRTYRAIRDAFQQGAA